MKHLYVAIVLFSLSVVLGGYLIEPLLTLYLVFYRDLNLFYALPFLGFLFYVSSFTARVLLALHLKYTRIYAIVSAILLPLSVLMYMSSSRETVFFVRILHGFSLSALVTSMWITLLFTAENRGVLGRYVGVYNASMGLSTSIAFVLSYKLVLDYGFNWLFIVALVLCTTSFAFTIFLKSIGGLSRFCKGLEPATANIMSREFRVFLIVLLVLASVFVKNLGYGIVRPFLPVYIVLFFNHVLLAWSVFVYAGLAYVLGSITGIIVLKTSSAKLSLLLSLLAMSMGALTYAYADIPEKFIVASILTSYTSALFKVSYIGYLSRIIKEIYEGTRVIVAALSLASLGSSFGYLLSFSISDARFSFIVYSVLVVISLLILLPIVVLRTNNA